MNENFDLMKAARNDFVYSTNNAEEALDFLRIRDESTLLTVARDITVTPIAPGDQRLFPGELASMNVVHHSIADNLRADYDPVKAYEECCNDTKLLICRGNGYERYLLRPQALKGLLSTTLTSGSGWGILQSKNNNDFANAINCFLTVRPRDITLIEVWGAVTAVASDRYTALPQYALLDTLLRSAESGQGKLTKFLYSHEMTYATVEFPPELVRRYSLEKLKFDASKAKMLMNMRTSDNLNSAATVAIEITDGEKTMATTSAYVAHKGQSSLERFEESCNSRNTALQEVYDQLVALSEYSLQYGESTIREVGKRMSIPDSVMVKAIKEAKIRGMLFDKMTAYDGYLFICELISTLNVNKSKTKSFCGNEAMIENYIKTDAKAKVAMLRWTDIDQERHYKDITNLNAHVFEDPNQISLFDPAE